MDINPPEPPGGHGQFFHETDEYYVNFYHTKYRLFENYPFHLLNVVGYWAETEIFGGVVLFEHEGDLAVYRSVDLWKNLLTNIRSPKPSCTRKGLIKPSRSQKNSSILLRT